MKNEDRRQFSSEGGQIKRSEMSKYTPAMLSAHFCLGGKLVDDAPATVAALASGSISHADFTALSPAEKSAFCREGGKVELNIQPRRAANIN